MVRPELPDEVDDVARVGVPAVQARVPVPNVVDEARIDLGERREPARREPAIGGQDQIRRAGQQQIGEIRRPQVASQARQDPELTGDGAGDDVHHRESLPS
jgi:hypothetical protein